MLVKNYYFFPDSEDDLKRILSLQPHAALLSLTLFPCSHVSMGSAVSLNTTVQTPARQNTQALVPRNRYYDHPIYFIGWRTVADSKEHRRVQI